MTTLYADPAYRADMRRIMAAERAQAQRTRDRECWQAWHIAQGHMWAAQVTEAMWLALPEGERLAPWVTAEVTA